MKKYRALLFEGGKQDGLSLSSHEFLTYCELRDSECAIIVHVPELRRFGAEAKGLLGEVAWEAAQTALQKQEVAKPGMKLAIGMRGIALYDRVLVGTVATNLESAKSSLTDTIVTARAEQSLYPFFQVQTLRLPAN